MYIQPPWHCAMAVVVYMCRWGVWGPPEAGSWSSRGPRRKNRELSGRSSGGPRSGLGRAKIAPLINAAAAMALCHGGCCVLSLIVVWGNVLHRDCYGVHPWFTSPGPTGWDVRGCCPHGQAVRRRLRCQLRSR